MAQQPKYYCTIHGDLLICPTCEGKKGGRKTAKVHAGKHSAWGKLGGRPKRKKAKRRRAGKRQVKR